jgi:hypothetical protein
MKVWLAKEVVLSDGDDPAPRRTVQWAGGRTLVGAETPVMPQMWVVAVHSPKKNSVRNQKHSFTFATVSQHVHVKSLVQHRQARITPSSNGPIGASIRVKLPWVDSIDFPQRRRARK